MPKSKQIPQILETIGDHIKKRRIDLGLVQKDLAERFGTSEDSVSNWEKSERTPSFQFAPAIINFLGYNPFPFETHTLGGRIKYYRLLNGINSRELAKRLKVDKSTLFAWETNRTGPSPKSLKFLTKLIEMARLDP